MESELQHPMMLMSTLGQQFLDGRLIDLFGGLEAPLMRIVSFSLILGLSSDGVLHVRTCRGHLSHIDSEGFCPTDHTKNRPISSHAKNSGLCVSLEDRGWDAFRLTF